MSVAMQAAQPRYVVRRHFAPGPHPIGVFAAEAHEQPGPAPHTHLLIERGTLLGQFFSYAEAEEWIAWREAWLERVRP